MINVKERLKKLPTGKNICDQILFCIHSHLHYSSIMRRHYFIYKGESNDNFFPPLIIANRCHKQVFIRFKIAVKEAIKNSGVMLNFYFCNNMFFLLFLSFISHFKGFQLTQASYYILYICILSTIHNNIRRHYSNYNDLFSKSSETFQC